MTCSLYKQARAATVRLIARLGRIAPGPMIPRALCWTRSSRLDDAPSMIWLSHVTGKKNNNKGAL